MKKLTVIALSVLLSLLCFRDVRADIGPKPSVNITFIDAPDTPYYVTLLSDAKVYGPWQEVNEESIASKSGEEQAAYRAFFDYAKDDDYHFLNYVGCPEDGRFSWSYYPPSGFKIAVYDVASGKLVVSKPLKREAFDSYFTVRYDLDHLEIKEEVKIGKKLLGFAFRMIVTILVELLIGLLFGYRGKKEVKTIVIVNMVTQLILNLILLFIDYYSGYLAWLIFFPILEVVVINVEAITYLARLREHRKLKTIIYAILANALTFLIGVYSSPLFY